VVVERSINVSHTTEVTVPEAIAQGLLEELWFRQGVLCFLLFIVLHLLFLLSSFFFFESGSCFVAQASLKLETFSSLCFPSAGITGVYHNAWLIYSFFFFFF
jgi:hypothetical protein